MIVLRVFTTPTDSCLTTISYRWCLSALVLFLALPSALMRDVDVCGDEAPCLPLDRALLQVGSSIQRPHTELDRAFVLRERKALDDDDGSGGIGDLAPLDENGYRSVAAVCCPKQMTAFTRRVIAKEGLHVCNKGGVSGLVIWFDCPDDNQSYAALMQNLHEATTGPCPYLRSGPVCMPRQDDCPSFPDSKMPPCGGEKHENKIEEATVHYKAIVHYIHLEDSGACSIEGPFEHERCHCKNQAETECRTKCNLDDNCRGYVRAPHDGCDLATTSDCDINCKKLNVGKVGDLVTPGRWSTGATRHFYGGCWKKKEKSKKDEEREVDE